MRGKGGRALSYIPICPIYEKTGMQQASLGKCDSEVGQWDVFQ